MLHRQKLVNRHKWLQVNVGGLLENFELGLIVKMDPFFDPLLCQAAEKGGKSFPSDWRVTHCIDTHQRTSRSFMNDLLKICKEEQLLNEFDFTNDMETRETLVKKVWEQFGSQRTSPRSMPMRHTTETNPHQATNK